MSLFDKLLGIFTNKDLDIFEFKSCPPGEEDYSDDDLKMLIRDINTELLLGNIVLTPKIKNLNRKTIKKCRKLSKKGMVIGGSVLLKACGLLDRKTNDIDVFWDVSKAKEEGLITQDNIINSNRDYFNTVIRHKVDLPEYGELDIFQEDYNEEFQPSTIEGINFKNPVHTLEAKFNYHRQKDNIDFWHIKEKFNL